MTKTHPFFLVGGNHTLYEFPDKASFRAYCQAMARGVLHTPEVSEEDLANLPADVNKEQARGLWSRPRSVSPQDFGAEFRGRVWDMSDGSLEPNDWWDLDRLLEYSVTDTLRIQSLRTDLRTPDPTT